PQPIEITASIDRYITYSDSDTPTRCFHVDIKRTGGIMPNTTSETKNIENKISGLSFRTLMCRSKFSTIKSSAKTNNTKITASHIKPRKTFLNKKRDLDSGSCSCSIFLI